MAAAHTVDDTIAELYCVCYSADSILMQRAFSSCYWQIDFREEVIAHYKSCAVLLILPVSDLHTDVHKHTQHSNAEALYKLAWHILAQSDVQWNGN